MCVLSCCYDNIPNKSNLWEEWSVLTHSLWGYNPHGKEAMVARAGGAIHTVSTVRKERANKK